jgi:hypothetical protein
MNSHMLSQIPWKKNKWKENFRASTWRGPKSTNISASLKISSERHKGHATTKPLCSCFDKDLTRNYTKPYGNKSTHDQKLSTNGLLEPENNRMPGWTSTPSLDDGSKNATNRKEISKNNISRGKTNDLMMLWI